MNRPAKDQRRVPRDVLALITDISGGEVAGVTDVYSAQSSGAPVSVSLAKINGVLGSSFSREEVEDVLESVVDGLRRSRVSPVPREKRGLNHHLIERRLLDGLDAVAVGNGCTGGGGGSITLQEDGVTRTASCSRASRRRQYTQPQSFLHGSSGPTPQSGQASARSRASRPPSRSPTTTASPS